MKELIEALTAFAKVAKNNTVGVCLTIVMVFVLISGFILMTNISNRVNHAMPSPAVESARFDRANKATEAINTMLDQQIAVLKADRAGVRQFHNGKTDLSGLPFTYVSTTFARTKEGVAFPDANYSPVPSSTISEITSAMWADYKHPVCLTIYTDEIKSQQYRRYTKNLGVEVFYVCPVSNANMYPVGFVFVSYLRAETERPTDEQIIANVTEIAGRVSDQLGSVTHPERPWWEFWKKDPSKTER